MKVFVRDLILPCRIGVYSHEQHGEQRVRINLELTCVEHPAINDEHHNVVCYAEVVDDIRRLIDEGHINLVETLAERIAAQCLEDHRILGRQGAGREARHHAGGQRRRGRDRAAPGQSLILGAKFD
jgi:dihydroneopterin aldolase